MLGKQCKYGTSCVQLVHYGRNDAYNPLVNQFLQDMKNYFGYENYLKETRLTILLQDQTI